MIKGTFKNTYNERPHNHDEQIYLYKRRKHLFWSFTTVILKSSFQIRSHTNVIKQDGWFHYNSFPKCFSFISQLSNIPFSPPPSPARFHDLKCIHVFVAHAHRSHKEKNFYWSKPFFNSNNATVISLLGIKLVMYLKVSSDHSF